MSSNSESIWWLQAKCTNPGDKICDTIPHKKHSPIKISRNHAFRAAFNAKLIKAGVDCNERCLVLGHSMQTNERHYSFSDRRKVEDIRNKLNELKMA